MVKSYGQLKHCRAYSHLHTTSWYHAQCLAHYKHAFTSFFTWKQLQSVWYALEPKFSMQTTGSSTHRGI